jgi:protein-disulfide isomerase
MDRFERVINVVLAIAAVAIAATFVYREFAHPSAAELTGADPSAPPRYVANWKEALNAGIQIGDTAAPVKVVEFGDFECPYCRHFDSTMHAVEARYPKAVSLVFVHFPLPSHRFARPAARVAECAARQGRFAAVHDLLYEKQDSFGLKTWSSYAKDAGVPDSSGFAACAVDTTTIPRVEAGINLGRKLGVHATPTVIVNGWEFAVPPTDTSLSSTVDALLAGKRPPGAQPSK